MLSFMLLASIVESRSVLGLSLRTAAYTPDCVSVQGAVSGDTCSAVSRNFTNEELIWIFQRGNLVLTELCSITV
ncbi:hypothetical protein NC653_004966 [Populus alba x Populus x berolinensis]|uniref:Secreted protein n=1 Tax=Populus alba x Populus x berolinensis TaxID=444605 RepID=A0AAD6RB57_9ROSI|nr:hypothetical protein NC653_004966 [Populus alba x Populus x berolinensis]